MLNERRPRRPTVERGRQVISFSDGQPARSERRFRQADECRQHPKASNDSDRARPTSVMG